MAFLERELRLSARGPLLACSTSAPATAGSRTASPAPIGSLGDYCCVDAIPESTFLCEYYLRTAASRRARASCRCTSRGRAGARAFDLALNIHSFSECTLAAVEWWVERLPRCACPS